MDKKICFITGANAGIGKAAAIKFAKNGFKVLIGCRNKSKGQQAIDDIKEQNKNADIELFLIDMSSFHSIKKCAENLRNKYNKLDVLIHNAADFDISRKKVVFTPENIEQVFATNHLGVVLLTDLLLDLLKKSSHARILTVASQGLVLHPNLKIDLIDPEFKHKKFSLRKAYYQSKLAQVMYTYWLADKLKQENVTVHCIRVTNVKIDISRYPNISGFMKFLYSIKSKFSISPQQMAETYFYVATSNDLINTTGKYFNEKNQIVKSSKYSLNSNNRNELMALTYKYLTGK